jgi:Flp pilus assembly protein TadG
VSIRISAQRLRQRFRADANKGSAAIEFAFIAPIFFVLLLGIFESAILFFSQAALQSGVSTAGRLVRTGQTACYSGSGSSCKPITEAQLKQQICNAAGALLPSCTTKLTLDMEASPSGFGSVSVPVPTSNNADPSKQTFTAPDKFDLGDACDVVVVRAYYQWPVVTPVLTWFLVNLSGGNHLLTGATAFRNEPFDAGAVC